MAPGPSVGRTVKEPVVVAVVVGRERLDPLCRGDAWGSHRSRRRVRTVACALVFAPPNERASYPRVVFFDVGLAHVLPKVVNVLQLPLADEVEQRHLQRGAQMRSMASCAATASACSAWGAQ